MNLSCAFAAALPSWRGEIELELQEGATVAIALAAAREALRQRLGPAADAVLASPEWHSGATGIFGEPCARDRRVQAGDRVELYLPLQVDPKVARRARARPMQTQRGRNPLSRR